MPLLPFLATALSLSFVPQTSNTTASLRGLSAVSSGVAWASGTGGTFLHTSDGGMHWQAGQVAGAEKLDFRDVQAFDDKTALLLSIGSGASSRIYKSVDAGAHWKVALQNTEATGFFDAFAFWDRRHGILLGDPVDGHFTIYVTRDGGDSWTHATQPPALQGEGAFAASGSSITVQGSRQVWFGSGGANVSRVFHSADGGNTWSVSAVPMASVAQSAGVFSVNFRDSRHGYAVGGDYEKPSESAKTIAITKDGGRTWQAGVIAGGFRSAVLDVSKPKRILLAVGPSGASFSVDDGRTWQNAAAGNLNAVAGVGTDIWAVGAKGLIEKLSFTDK